MNVPDLLSVGGAGSAGAVARFVADGVVRTRPGRSRLPVATMAVNLSGSLLLGVLTGLVLFHRAPAGVTLVAGTGFCGGYTTFSTASVEAVRLLHAGDVGAAVTASLATLAGALAAAALGLAITAV